jgi:hypothetical protein
MPAAAATASGKTSLPSPTTGPAVDLTRPIGAESLPSGTSGKTDLASINRSVALPVATATVAQLPSSEAVSDAKNMLPDTALPAQAFLASHFQDAAGHAPVHKPFRFEVTNGNGTAGLARRIGRALSTDGAPMPQLTNLKPYRQKETVIQYRQGFHDEALQLSRRFAQPPEIVQSVSLRSSTDIRLVLGKGAAVHSMLAEAPFGASMTMAQAGAQAREDNAEQVLIRPSRENEAEGRSFEERPSGNPLTSISWIPAFAGMTTQSA